MLFQKFQQFTNVSNTIVSGAYIRTCKTKRTHLKFEWTHFFGYHTPLECVVVVGYNRDRFGEWLLDLATRTHWNFSLDAEDKNHPCDCVIRIIAQADGYDLKTMSILLGGDPEATILSEQERLVHENYFVREAALEQIRDC